MPPREQQHPKQQEGPDEDTDAPLPEALDPQVAAKRARLRYVSDASPGITRHPAKDGFDYRLPDGALVRDVETLRRIRSLAIPPAWTEVWICPDPNGHLQATGRDANAGASNTAIIRAGAKCATRRNTPSCWSSPASCR